MQFIQNFSIVDSPRLSEFIEFKNENLHETNFRYEPILNASNGSYKVSIRCNASDLTSLELLFDKWEKEDSNAESKNISGSLMDKLFTYLRAN